MNSSNPDVDDSSSRTTPQWSTSPSTKAKNAVQRCVTALLDELAPERVLKRADALPAPVEQHRNPTGCLLQAADFAVSVSWFPDAAANAPLGELHVLVWRGKVTRRGMAPTRKGATIIADLVLHPVEPSVDSCVWQAADGARYDTASLAAHCLTLLETQINARG
jgi:hypothetical protein